MRIIWNWGLGWDLGLMVWRWKRWGPFMLYREMLTTQGNPPPLGPWRFAIFLSKRALDEFYEGSTK